MSFQYKVIKDGKSVRVWVRSFKSSGGARRFEIWCRRSGLFSGWVNVAYTQDVRQIESLIHQCFGISATVVKV